MSSYHYVSLNRNIYLYLNKHENYSQRLQIWCWISNKFPQLTGMKYSIKNKRGSNNENSLKLSPFWNLCMMTEFFKLSQQRTREYRKGVWKFDEEMGNRSIKFDNKANYGYIDISKNSRVEMCEESDQNHQKTMRDRKLADWKKWTRGRIKYVIKERRKAKLWKIGERKNAPNCTNYSIFINQISKFELITEPGKFSTSI